jgi:hypothetical protein
MELEGFDRTPPPSPGMQLASSDDELQLASSDDELQLASSQGMQLQSSDNDADAAPPCTPRAKKPRLKGVKRSVKKTKPDPMLALKDGRITRETLPLTFRDDEHKQSWTIKTSGSRLRYACFQGDHWKKGVHTKYGECALRCRGHSFGWKPAKDKRYHKHNEFQVGTDSGVASYWALPITGRCLAWRRRCQAKT